MITSRLGFLLDALDLTQSGVAREIGVSIQHVHNICAGHSKPSYEIANKLERILKQTWELRRGVTVPPEVAKIVFEILYPPPPFDPFNQRGPGRPRKETKGSIECNSQQGLPVQASAFSSSTIHAYRESESEQSYGSEDNSCEPLSTPNGSKPTRSSEPESRVFSHRGSKPSRAAENLSVTWESGLLNDPKYAISVLRQIAALDPVPQKLLAKFKADCAKQMWALRWKESCREQKAYRFLADKAGIQLRKRGQDVQVQARNAHILSTVGPAIAWLRKNSTHSKGAYDTRSFGFRRQQIGEVLNMPQVARALVDEETGETPSIAMVERILRDANWGVDSRNEPDDFVQRTIGWRPRFAGDVILADWTGLPIQVEGAVLEEVNRRTGAKEKRFKKFGMHVAVDAATNFTWCDQTYGDNEYATWPRFLEWLLFKGLGYRPNVLVMDKVSGVVTSLLNGSPDEPHTNVMAEVIAWIAAGATFHVHLPEHANAKGHVEVAAKLLKHRELNALTVRKCLEKHMRGNLVKPRDLVSHAEALRLMLQMQENANKRILHRDGHKLGPRFELWSNAEDAVLREERAFTDDAQHVWRDVVSKAKHVWVNGKTATLRVSGKKHYAELRGFEELGLGQVEDSAAWIVPPLPGVGVDLEEYRVCLVQKNKGGLPRFHPLTARISVKDRFAFDEMRPYLGAGYHALPSNNKERTKSTIDLAEQRWKKEVAGLREGTTGEEVGRTFE